MRELLQHSLPGAPLKPEETGSWAHRPQQCGIMRAGLEWFLGALEQVWLNKGGVATIIPAEAAREALSRGIRLLTQRGRDYLSHQ